MVGLGLGPRLGVVIIGASLSVPAPHAAAGRDGHLPVYPRCMSIMHAYLTHFPQITVTSRGTETGYKVV